MKHSILSVFLVMAASLSAGASEYRCGCRDTGYECDGYNQMNLVIEDGVAQVAFSGNLKTDPENMITRLTGTLSTRYNPRTNVGFDRYVTQNRIFPQLLIEKSMSEGGAASGTLKMPEYSDDGQFGNTWEFGCRRVK